MTLAAGLLLGQRPPGPPPGLHPPPNIAMLDRLERMSPEQRQRFLDRLAPERRQRLQSLLRRYESMTPEERDRVRHQYGWFHQLPPERQEAARQLFRRFNELPEDRRRAVRHGVWELRRLDDSIRQRRLNSAAFRTRYSPDEQQMVRDFLEVMPPHPNPESR